MMIKKILFLLLSIGFIRAQMPVVTLIDAMSSCKESPGTMFIIYDINIAPGGGVWVEWNHLGSWHLVQNSQHFTIAPGIDSYSFSITSTLDSLLTAFPEDSMYRFRFVDIITETYITVDTFFTHCLHTFSLEEYEYWPIVSVESYNMHGQQVTEETKGLIIEVYTFVNNKKRAIKKWR